MKIKPLGERLFIELLPVEEGKTSGGIYLPDKHSEITRIAKILDMGENVNKDKFHIGDKIIAGFWAGVVLHLPKEGYLSDTHRFVTEDEILAKIEEQ